MKTNFGFSRSRPVACFKAPRTMLGAVAIELMKHRLVTLDTKNGVVRPIAGISVVCENQKQRLGWAAAAYKLMGRPDKRYEGHHPHNYKNSGVTIRLGEDTPDRAAMILLLQGIFAGWPTVKVNETPVRQNFGAGSMCSQKNL